MNGILIVISAILGAFTHKFGPIFGIFHSLHDLSWLVVASPFRCVWMIEPCVDEIAMTTCHPFVCSKQETPYDKQTSSGQSFLHNPCLHWCHTIALHCLLVWVDNLHASNQCGPHNCPIEVDIMYTRGPHIVSYSS